VLTKENLNKNQKLL